MARSTKLGIASVLLILGCALPSPLGVVSAAISCVLGLLAAQQGSKWWLVVPATIITLFAFIVYIGFHTP
jgi:uncharacterized membrane protein